MKMRLPLIIQFANDCLRLARQSDLTWREAGVALRVARQVMKEIDLNRNINDSRIAQLAHGAIAQELKVGLQ